MQRDLSCRVAYVCKVCKICKVCNICTGAQSIQNGGTSENYILLITRGNHGFFKKILMMTAFQVLGLVLRRDYKGARKQSKEHRQAWCLQI